MQILLSVLWFFLFSLTEASEFFQYQSRYSQAHELAVKAEKLIRPQGSIVHGGGNRILYFGDKAEWEKINKVLVTMDQPVQVMQARLKLYGERLEKQAVYGALVDLRADSRGRVGVGVSTMLNFRREKAVSSNMLQVVVNANEPYAFQLSRQTVEAISPFFVIEKDQGVWAEMVMTPLDRRVRVEVRIQKDLSPDEARFFGTLDVPYNQWVPLFVNEGAINLFTEVFIDSSEPHRL